MTDPDLITILHISDFHYAQGKAREQGIIVDALVDDLKKLCIGHRKPDVILFTGDLVQAAGADPHDEAYDFFIERVSKATGTSDDRIFLTPGNHDLSRLVTEEAIETHREWRFEDRNDGVTPCAMSDYRIGTMRRSFCNTELGAYSAAY